MQVRMSGVASLKKCAKTAESAGSHRHIVAMLDRIPDCDLEVRLYCCTCHLLLHRWKSYLEDDLC